MNHNEILNVPEWAKTDKFHIPLGKVAVGEIISSVPGVGASNRGAQPGDIAPGAGIREKVVLDSHPNPRNVIGHPSNTIDQDIRNVAGL